MVCDPVEIGPKARFWVQIVLLRDRGGSETGREAGDNVVIPSRSSLWTTEAQFHGDLWATTLSCPIQGQRTGSIRPSVVGWCCSGVTHPQALLPWAVPCPVVERKPSHHSTV